MIKDKIILLTGATDGIGKQAAFSFANDGATLLMHGKNESRGKQIKNEIIAKTKNKNIFYFNADLSSFNEIFKLTNQIKERFSHIDILINNAGIFERNKIILPNGIEKNFMVNHLASFFLTINILDLLKKTKNAKIINVSSMVHANNIDFDNLNAEKYYSGENAYSLTKLCNILFTKELNDVLNEDNITVNALHPGVIGTKLLKSGWGIGGNSTTEGAKRIYFLANSEEIENISGKYFENDIEIKPANICNDKNIRKKLWDISLNFLPTKL